MRRRDPIVERHDLIPAGRGDGYWSPVGPPEPSDGDGLGDGHDGGEAHAGAEWRLFWWGVEGGKPAEAE